MKLCALLIVAAACAVLLPSDVGARVASPDRRDLVRRSPLKIAKNQFAKREDDDDDDDVESLAAFFESDFVAYLLERYGITMKELDEIIEEDDEIDPEDRDTIKALTIMMMAGVDGALDSSEEDIST